MERGHTPSSGANAHPGRQARLQGCPAAWMQENPSPRLCPPHFVPAAPESLIPPPGPAQPCKHTYSLTRRDTCHWGWGWGARPRGSNLEKPALTVRMGRGWSPSDVRGGGEMEEGGGPEPHTAPPTQRASRGPPDSRPRAHRRCPALRAPPVPVPGVPGRAAVRPATPPPRATGSEGPTGATRHRLTHPLDRPRFQGSSAAAAASSRVPG